MLVIIIFYTFHICYCLPYRRCLKKFLYDELRKHGDPATVDDSIFAPFKEGVGFNLKEGYKFHLFITTAPCGDSRWVSKCLFIILACLILFA